MARGSMRHVRLPRKHGLGIFGIVASKHNKHDSVETATFCGAYPRYGLKFLCFPSEPI